MSLKYYEIIKRTSTAIQIKRGKVLEEHTYCTKISQKSKLKKIIISNKDKTLTVEAKKEFYKKEFDISKNGKKTTQ